MAVQLLNYIDDNNLGEPLQSTYKRHHSTEFALLKFYDDTLKAIDNRRTVVLLLLDLSAAFNTVDHGILIHRLESRFDFKGKALQWSPFLLMSLLVFRGDLFWDRSFVCYIPLRWRMEFHLYADDSKIYSSFDSSSFCLSAVVSRIQACLSDSSSWISLNRLKLKGDKTEPFIIGSQFRPSLQSPPIVLNDGSLILPSKYARKIGVTFVSELNFERHITDI